MTKLYEVTPTPNNPLGIKITLEMLSDPNLSPSELKRIRGLAGIVPKSEDGWVKQVPKKKKAYKANKNKKKKVKNMPTSAYYRFFYTKAWLELRDKVLEQQGHFCQKCGAKPSKTKKVILQVDHIVPRIVDRSKELDINNLQVLCKQCNKEKGMTIARYVNQFPTTEEELENDQVSPIPPYPSIFPSSSESNLT